MPAMEVLWSLPTNHAPLPSKHAQTMTELNEESKEASREDDDDDKDKQEVMWGKSRARDWLFNFCLRSDVPKTSDAPGGKPKQIWEAYNIKDVPAFGHFQDYSKFATRLAAARKRANKKTEQRDIDAAAFAHDRKIWPAPTKDTRGEPMWAGSEAQKLLRRDIEDPEKMDLKPKFLQLEEPEYLEFSLDNFRNRIYQEVKAKKRIVYLNDKATKKAEKEAKKKNKGKKKQQ